MATKPDENPFDVGGTAEKLPRVDPAKIGQPAASGGRSSDSTRADTDRADIGNATGIGNGTRTAKRRGRPPGSKNKTEQKADAITVDKDAVTAILLSCHAMLAGITKTPELAIDANEAALLGDGIAKVAILYDVTASPKTVAWCNLAMVTGMVYGTRIMAISARKKDARKKRTDKVRPIRAGVDIDGVNIGGGMPPFEYPTTPNDGGKHGTN